jgi:hypothetical protein
MIMKKRKTKYIPQYGDTRDVYRYAFFPTWVEDKLIWLEGFYKKQRFSRRQDGYDSVDYWYTESQRLARLCPEK